MEHTDSDVWAKEYKPIFFPDPGEVTRQSSKAKLAEAKPGQQGSLNIKRAEAKPVTDLAQFLGRAGGTGKSDPNKAALAKIAKARSDSAAPAIRIGPDDAGNLSLDTPNG